MYKAYPEEKNNTLFDDAINFYNKFPEVKNGIKKMVKVDGNLAKNIKEKFKTGQEFIDAVLDLTSQLDKSKKENAKRDEIKREYKQIQKDAKSNKTQKQFENDFWLFPCKTYKELHTIICKYIGQLPMLSRKMIKAKYNVEVPEKGRCYDCDMSPKEFFEWAKNEDRFFMDPSWCTAKNERFFKRYDLEVEENENAKCYVVISKLYPNLRFCISKGAGDDKMIFLDGDEITITENGIGEIRDPWQIGGTREPIEYGLQVMKLAFGENKTDELLNEIKNSIGQKETKIQSFEIQNGVEMFKENLSLKSFNHPLTKLENGTEMFKECQFLKTFNSSLPKLENGTEMFNYCISLQEFNVDMPQLKNGKRMFCGCYQLSDFSGDLSSLRDGFEMFKGCQLNTKSIKNIAQSIPNTRKGRITLDVDEMDEEKERYFQMIENKGWVVDFSDED